MKLNFFSLLSFCSIMLFTEPLQSAYTIKNGRIMDTCDVATMSAEKHFEAGAISYEAWDWPAAARHFSVVIFNFPSSTYAQEAYYFLGVCYYFMEEYDYANESFTDYLKVQGNPKYFQSTVEFKFTIAEHLNAGAKRRFFGSKKLPKWLNGQSLALEIYDEVIAAVPCSDLAAQALIAKACLNWRLYNYRPAVDSLQMVIRRFPKYEKTPDCYIYIGKIYLEQSRFEFQNSDILAFAQINLRKFERDFPREERLCEAQEDVMAIKEIYANGLYETGRFYERTCKPKAAMIYYNDGIRQFPETCVADFCRSRMLVLNPTYCESTASVTGETIDEESAESEDINVSGLE